MIHVGIFTSHLPYIVIALIYGLYLLSGLFTAEVPADVELDVLDPIVISVEDYTYSNGESIFHFEYTISEKIESRVSVLSFIHLLVQQYFVENHFLIQKEYFSVLFSRPPPYTA